MSQFDPSPFASIADLLRKRLEIIADREFYAQDPEGHLNALKDVAEKIAGEQQRLAPQTPPRLAHFLEGCSYDKALAFIEGAARGSDRP